MCECDCAELGPLKCRYLLLRPLRVCNLRLRNLELVAGVLADICKRCNRCNCRLRAGVLAGVVILRGFDAACDNIPDTKSPGPGGPLGQGRCNSRNSCDAGDGGG